MPKKDFDILRKNMVSQQLIPRGITNEFVIRAFEKVPRHLFVKNEFVDSAYDDHPLPIGGGQTISQPYMVAIMTELLRLKGGEKILEIGAGSGYQAAILAEIVRKVYTVERIEPIAKACRHLLERLGYDNVEVVTGDGTLGYKAAMPYDGIIVTCGAPGIPSSLLEQLKPGGRLLIPVGAQFSQVLTVVEKTNGSVETHQICGCVFVPLIGKDGWKG